MKFFQKLFFFFFLVFLLSLINLSVFSSDIELNDELASSLLKSDFKQALEALKKCQNLPEYEEMMKILFEASKMDDFVLKSFEKQVGLEFELLTKQGERKIKLLSVKEGKIYFEEKDSGSPVKSAIGIDRLSEDEKLKRLEGMSEETKSLILGAAAYRTGDYQSALSLFEKCGPFSDELKSIVNKKLKPTNDFFLAMSKGDIQSARKILDENPDISMHISCKTKDSSGMERQYFTTFLHEALMLGQTDIAKMLVEKGAPINVQNSNGLTPLMVAIMKSHNDDTDMIQFLLNAGANPNIQDKSGDSALTGAISLKRFKAAELLVKKGANPNLPNKKGLTPLMLAVFSGNVPITRFLLDNGADITAKNKDGWSLLDIGHDNRSPEMKKLLEPIIKKYRKEFKTLNYDFGDGIDNMNRKKRK